MSSLFAVGEQANNAQEEDKSQLVTLTAEQYEKLKERSKYISKKASQPRPRKVKPPIIKAMEDTEKSVAKESSKKNEGAPKEKTTRRIIKKSALDSAASTQIPKSIEEFSKEFEVIKKTQQEILQLHKSYSQAFEEERQRKEAEKKTKQEEKAKKKKEKAANPPAPRRHPHHDIWEDAKKKANDF